MLRTTQASKFARTQAPLELPPDHLVDDAGVGLDDLDDLGRDVLVDVVRDRGAVVAGGIHGDGGLDGLQQGAGVDAGDEEAGLVQRLGPLGRRADADGRERMAHGCEEGALLRQGAGIRHHGKGIHLKAVIVMEPEGLMLDDAAVEFKPGGLQPLARTRVAGIQDRHVILLSHGIDRRKQGNEILLRIDVLLPMGRQQNIAALLQTQALVNIRSLDLGQVLVQHLRHRRARHIRPLLRQAAVRQVTTCMLRIGHVDVADDVHDPAVRLLRQALILAPVARLHMEDRDVQPLRADDAQTRVRIPQHQHRIGLHLDHQLVALRNDIAHRLPQIGPDGLHVDIRVSELQVLEEHAIEVVIIILSGVGQQAVEILPALVDHRRQPDDLRPRPHNNQKLQLPVIRK